MHLFTAERMGKRRVCAAIAALTLVFLSFFAAIPRALAESDGMVRVRLTRLGAPGAVTMVADCDYYLAADPTVRVKSGERMTVRADGDALTLSAGDRRAALGTTAWLMRAGSGNAGARFLQPELSNRFSGDLGFHASDGVVNTVLSIYVENYLYGVVGYEMPPSSGIEALKAQAVAARTYAMYKKALRSGAAYDLTDAAVDQVYRGYSDASEYANVVRAVDATRGGVLYDGDNMAQCYYCASNGGQTESSGNAWGTALRYCVVKDDPYDLQSAGVVRTASINKDLSGIDGALKQALIDGLTAQLEAQGLSADASTFQVNGLESVTACDSRYAAPSRVYRSLTFRLNVTGVAPDGVRRTGSMSVGIPTYGAFEEWYGLSINEQDNETVWVEENEKAFVVSFRRFGHGVGMSQRGAQVMAADYGMSAAEILAFYYPGTKGRRMELTDSTRDLKAAVPAPEQQAIGTARLLDRTDLLSAPNDAGAATATAAAGAVVEVYAVQGDWAAVGVSGKYGFVPVDALESYTPKGSEVVRPSETTYAVALEDASVLQLPVAQANPVASMAAGSDMQVFAWTEEWAMVEAPNGFMGFVPVASIRLRGAPEASVEAAEPAEEATGGVTTAGPDLYGQLRQDSPIYVSNNELSASESVLYQGSLVKIIAYDQSWARVRTREGAEGYLPLNCIRALDTAQREASASEVDGGPIKRVSGAKYLYVKGDSARVYASWSADADVIAMLAGGDRVQLGAYNERWACVRLADGTTGYMLFGTLTDQAPASSVEGGAITRAPSGAAALAVRDGVPVYRDYAEDSDRIAELSVGERVAVGAYNAIWAMVRFDGLTGYVRVADLKLVK